MLEQNKIASVKEALKTSFSDEVGKLLQPSNKKGTALLNFLQGRAHHLNLPPVDPYELLSDATMRGLNYIETHEQEIYNVHAWLRRVCLYILADMVKAEKQERHLYAKNSASVETDDPFSQMESEEARRFLTKALARLPESEQELLTLKYIHNYSYQSIQQYLATRGSNVKLPALRQRGTRALKKLRTLLEKEYKAK